MRRSLLLMLLALTISGCASLPATREETGTSAPSSKAPSVPKRGTGAPPGPSAALLEQGRAQLAAGDYSQAAASLERAIRIEPGNPWLWLELAKVHFTSGNLPQAESHARKALSLSGHDAAARDAAGKLLEAIAAH